MPFKEIKQPTNFIRIKSFGQTTVSISLYNKHFKDKNVKIFHDKGKKIIGLQPSNKGYKIFGTVSLKRFACHALSRITTGEFYPEWSEKDKMLVFTYG